MRDDLRKFLKGNGPYYISFIYAFALIFLCGAIDKDNIFHFAVLYAFFITVPLQVILAITYAVFAYEKDNKFTPLVPVIVISSLYIFFDYYLLGSMPLDLGLIIAGFILLTILICIIIRIIKSRKSK